MPGQPPCAPGMSRDRLHCPPKLFPNDPHSCEYATKEGDRAPLQGRCSANVHLSEGPGRHRSCCYVHARSVAHMESRMRRAEPSAPESIWMGSTRPVRPRRGKRGGGRSEEHTSELQSPCNLVCRLLLEKKKKKILTVR